VLKTMVDDTFTRDYGVKVNVKLVQADAILTAVVAGNGPDVVLSVSGWFAVNYAMRNAVEDLTQFPDYEKVECADVGTGSGAIAIAVALEEPKVVMHATDISEEALVTARQNAEINGAEIDFTAGDMLEPLIAQGRKLDVLISNPPYIPADEQMEKSVVDFEPHVALFGGSDGLYFYRKIFAGCRSLLKEKAFMAFEMGWDQRERMSRLVEEMLPEAEYEIVRDMNGKDRMLFVYFNLNRKDS
jgi:release factor glutamine methyltransferase